MFVWFFGGNKEWLEFGLLMFVNEMGEIEIFIVN